MAYTFDEAALEITLGVGQTDLDVKDLYSRWKEWAKTNENIGLAPEAFLSVGGNVIDAGAGTSIPAYIYIANGWVIIPDDADHTLNVTNGIILREDGGDPFGSQPGRTIKINYQQPVQAITVGLGDIYPDISNAQAMRLLIDALVLGKVIPPGVYPGSLYIRDKDDTKNRVVATVNTDGTRTPTSYDPD